MSGRQDSNLRPPGPKPGALPDCATPRFDLASAKVDIIFETAKYFSVFYLKKTSCAATLCLKEQNPDRKP